MFIAHFGIGFGAKKIAPAVSLAALFIAAQFLDLLWPVLLLMDLEHVRIVPEASNMTPLEFYDYPISHSLIMTISWGLTLSAVGYFFLKNKKTAVVIFFCVISHWFLDLLVHRPDLPLVPGTNYFVGLGLWQYPLAAVALELVAFLGGVLIYTKTTIATNKIGKYGLHGLSIFLLMIQLLNAIGPPPPNVQAIAWAGNLQWLVILLALWIDKNRTPVAPAAGIDNKAMAKLVN